MCNSRVGLSAIAALLTAATLNAQSIFTIVGGGSNDGLRASEAALEQPWAVVIDSAGNLYIADGFLHQVRKVSTSAGGSSSAGTLSAFAGDGAGAYGGDGLPATSAQMFSPQDLAFDSDANLLILDQGNSAIRRVDKTTRIMTTIAGRGTSSADDIPATDAALSYPRSVAVDGNGSVYVADAGSIRQINAAGFIRTVVPSVAAFGVAVDPSGRFLYFSDGIATVKMKDLVTGAVSTVAGTGVAGYSGDSGAAAAAQVAAPGRLALDPSNNLYISDVDNRCVRRVDGQTKIISTVLSDVGKPLGLLALPATLYVVDQASNAVLAVNPATHAATRVAGNGERAFIGDGRVGPTASLAYPTSIALAGNGDLYIADALHDRIRKWTRSTSGMSGVMSTVAGTDKAGYGGDGGPATAAELHMPEGVAVDRETNEIYVADKLNRVIRKISVVSGTIVTVAGSGASGDGGDGGVASAATFTSPTRVAFDSSSRTLYVLDQDRGRVRRVKDGTIANFAGGGTSAADHIPATSAWLTNPVDIALDSAGNLYIADNLGARVRKVNASTGEITTVAGNGIAGFSGDGGNALNASIRPFALSVDTKGNLYVSDSPAINYAGSRSASHRIRKVDASGTMNTIAGSGPTSIEIGAFEGDNGAATAARLNNPLSVAVDATGNVFIADTFSNRIRMVPACRPVEPPDLATPAEGAADLSTAPFLSWDTVVGASGYDVYLSTANPPLLAVSDHAGTSIALSNLESGVTYFWRIVAKGDKFCSPAATAASAVRSFRTAPACVAPPAVTLVAPAADATETLFSVTLTWSAASDAGSYDLYFGPSAPPPLIATGLSTTARTLTGLTQRTRFFWFVVARAACDSANTSTSPTWSFTTAGTCTGAGTFTQRSPAAGASNVPLTTTLEWSASANVTTYDVYLGTSAPPPLYMSNVSTTRIGVAGLLSSRTYSWRVVANVPCDPTKNATSAVSTFTASGACTSPRAPAITFVPPGGVGIGQTYTVAWSESVDLDENGYYIVERSASPSFKPLIDSQQTFSPSASFLAASAGTYYHRVHAVPACDSRNSSGSSDVRPVSVVTDTPNVIFTVQPESVVTTLGEKLEDRKTQFTLENIGSSPITVSISRNEFAGDPFFSIRDPLGGNPVFATLEPRKPKRFEIVFGGPSKDTAGTHQGIVFVNGFGQPLAVTPYAFVNLKIGGGTSSHPLFVADDGTPTEYAFFSGYSGDDQNRPPITVLIRNDDSTPMDLGAEVGPDIWLVPENDWNAQSIPAGTSRPVRLRTERKYAPNGSALPRYTYFTVRSKSGQSARLLVQDNAAPVTAIGRASALEPGRRSFIVPGAVSTSSQFTRLRLTNIGNQPTQVTIYYTPEEDDGLSSAAVRAAMVVVPPNDVVALTDPLHQLFGIAPPARGQIEIRAAEDRIGSLLVSSAVITPVSSGGSYCVDMPTLFRGEGARIDSRHGIAGVAASSAVRATLLLVETTGNESAHVRVSLFDGQNAKVGERTYDVKRYGQTRIETIVQSLGGAEPFDRGRIDISVDSGAGAVVGVMTLLNPANGGASMASRPVGGTPLPTMRMSGSGAVASSGLATAFVPVVVNGRRTATGRLERTQLGFIVVTSPAATTTATVTFRPADPSIPPISKTIDVSRGVILQFENALEELFGIPKDQSASGAVFLQAASSIEVYAQMMSFSGFNWSITSGLPIMTSLSDAVTTLASKHPLYLDGLEQSVDSTRGTRWNVLINEVGGQSGEIVVRLYESGNRSVPIAESTFPIAAFQQLRLETVFKSMGLDSDERRKDRTNVLCVVAPESGSALVSAVGQEIDNATGAVRHLSFSPTGGIPSTGVLRVSAVSSVPPPTSPGRRRAVLP